MLLVYSCCCFNERLLLTSICPWSVVPFLTVPHHSTLNLNFNVISHNIKKSPEHVNMHVTSLIQPKATHNEMCTHTNKTYMEVQPWFAAIMFFIPNAFH